MDEFKRRFRELKQRRINAKTISNPLHKDIANKTCDKLKRELKLDIASHGLTFKDLAE